MDYSLLINVEGASIDSGDNKVKSRASNNNFLISQDGTEYYHLGIIDFLQKYDFGKKCEKFMKTATLSP